MLDGGCFFPGAYVHQEEGKKRKQNEGIAAFGFGRKSEKKLNWKFSIIYIWGIKLFLLERFFAAFFLLGWKLSSRRVDRVLRAAINIPDSLGGIKLYLLRHWFISQAEALLVELSTIRFPRSSIHVPSQDGFRPSVYAQHNRSCNKRRATSFFRWMCSWCRAASSSSSVLRNDEMRKKKKQQRS